MDEMKLHTKFMKNIVSKLIAKSICKKYGYKVDIQLGDLSVSIDDRETIIDSNVSIKIDSDSFKKIMTNMILKD